MNSKNDLEIPVYLFMFRKQQNSNSQQIKSFSSRVGRRGTKKQEEKEEEPTKPVAKPKSTVKKVVPKAKDLPNLKDDATPITIDDIENIYSDMNSLIIVIKPIVGPRDFSQPIDVSDSIYSEIFNTLGTSVNVKLIQREVTVYNTNRGGGR